MLNILRHLQKGIIPIVSMIILITLFIMGIFLFSYFLVISAIISLMLFIIVFTQLKIAKWKQQNKNKPHLGRIVESDGSP